MQTVKHLLAEQRSLWTIPPQSPVLDAIKLMARHHIGALPVVEDGTLLGIVSERDYARKIILHGRSSAATQVSQIMTSPVRTVTPDDDVNHCMGLMTRLRIRHLPVMQDGQLIGIVSIGDLVKAVMREQQQTIDELERYIIS